MVKKFFVSVMFLAVLTGVFTGVLWIIFQDVYLKAHGFNWQLVALGALLLLAAGDQAVQEDKRESTERELQKVAFQWKKLNGQIDDWGKLKDSAPLQEAVIKHLVALTKEVVTKTVAAQECAQRVYQFPAGDIKSVEGYSNELREALSQVEGDRRNLIDAIALASQLGFSKELPK